MIKVTVSNLGVSLKPNLNKTSRHVARKMKRLSSILSTKVDKQMTKNHLHVIKWIDGGGFVNIAFQVVIPYHLDGEINEECNHNSSSLVFAQNDRNEVLMSIYQYVNVGLKSKHVNKVLGTYSYDELTEPFILDKIKQFLDFEFIT